MGIIPQFAIAMGFSAQLGLSHVSLSATGLHWEARSPIGSAEKITLPSLSKKATPIPKPKTITSCPQTLEGLTNWLLQDIPGYANRALQQSWSLLQRSQNFNPDPKWLLHQIILAGRPEYEPLPPFILSQPTAKLDSQLQQVFFTTLERNYWNTSTPRISLSTSYHWMFLVADEHKWKLVQMFTRIGKSTNAKTALPPRDSTNGAIAKGIRVWLRDCQEGTLTSQPPTQVQKIER